MQGLVAQGPFSSTSTSCGFPHPCSAGGSPAEPRDHPNPPFPPQAVCQARYLAVGRLCLGDAPVQLAACGQVPGQALVGAGQPLAQRPEPRLQPPPLRLLLPDPLAQLVPPCPQLRQPCPARPGPSAPGLARHSPAPFTRPAPLTLQQRRVVALQRRSRLAHGGSRPGPANGPAALRLFLRRGPHGAAGGRGALGGLAPAQHRPGAARGPGAGERGAAGGGLGVGEPQPPSVWGRGGAGGVVVPEGVPGPLPVPPLSGPVLCSPSRPDEVPWPKRPPWWWNSGRTDRCFLPRCCGSLPGCALQKAVLGFCRRAWCFGGHSTSLCLLQRPPRGLCLGTGPLRRMLGFQQCSETLAPTGCCSAGPACVWSPLLGPSGLFCHRSTYRSVRVLDVLSPLLSRQHQGLILWGR